MEQGHAASEPLVEGSGDLLVLIRDDHDGIRLIKSLQHDVNHLCDDEVGKERVHRLVPAIEQSCRGEDKEVDEHNHLADGELRPRIHDDRDDLRPIEAAARTHDDADAETGHHAAEDRSEERVICHLRHIVKHARPDREHDDGKDRRQGKTLSDLLIPHKDKGDIIEHEEHAEAHARDRLRHDRQTDDAAVDDIVRDEEELEPHGGDEGAEDEPQAFFDVEKCPLWRRLLWARRRCRLFLCLHEHLRGTAVYDFVHTSSRSPKTAVSLYSIIEERKCADKSTAMRMAFLTLLCLHYMIAILERDPYIMGQEGCI